MLPGECVGGEKETKCTGCGRILPLKVCQSNAGYYIGYNCPNCGPYSRESGYFSLQAAAEAYLKEWLEKHDPKHMRWAQ